jgi:hypothetical protein
MLKVVEAPQPSAHSEPDIPMAVEESIATETIIERVRAYGANSVRRAGLNYTALPERPRWNGKQSGIGAFPLPRY